MANPAPTINQINAFNATQGTTIDFNIIGGTELVRSNKIYIYDLSDNSLICTHLYVSTESIHELPANTDSSIVYESGKSSADFVNGAQYYAQIQTFTDTAGTQGGSGLSVAKMFWCLVDPTLTITTIPSTISTTSYNVSATYTDTSASVVSNIIQQYQFNLYSAVGSLLQSSGVVVGSGTQQGTSDVYDISYNFTGLNVGSSYYVTVEVTTTQGMNVIAQSGTFTVSIDTPTLGEATVVNNACDGYISVTSNLSGEYGGSASGEIASFVTDSVNNISSLKVPLEPIQDLHGYDSPWVGGAGKNKFDKDNPNVVNGYITSSGFAEQNTRARTIYIPINPDTTYTVSKIASARFAIATSSVIPANEASYTSRQTGNTATSLTITSGASDAYLWAWVYLYDTDTESYNDVIDSIQIEEGSFVTPWTPYENICPISGHDEVGVSVCGKNLLDTKLYKGISYYPTVGSTPTIIENPTQLTDNGDGTFSITLTTSYQSVDFIVPIKRGVQYHWKTKIESNGTEHGVSYGYLDENKKILSKYNDTAFSKQFDVTLSQDNYLTGDNGYFYVAISDRSSAGATITITQPQLEFGTTATTYEPYNGQTYTTTLPSTTYGGTLDLVSGELTVTHEIVDMGDLAWGRVTSTSNPVLTSESLVGTIKIPTTTGQDPDILCSIYGTTGSNGRGNWARASSNGDISLIRDYGSVIVRDDTYTDANTFKTAMSGVQLVYPLATPTTTTLTPQQIQTLIGQNNVWSEQQGEIELSYHIPITNLLVKRQDVDDVSGNWLTLYSQPITQASDMDFTFIDFLNQYGKTYKYALVPLLTQIQSGVEVEVEGGYTVSDEVQSVFDGVFIVDSTGSQKCKANVGYGNVDMNQVVGSITPIGAKYPIVITNSQNQYHNGSISGTIVPDDYYFNGNLSRIDMVDKRNELEQFLTNKRAKIIKDWNGNIWLAMIMDNVNCTFNNSYGMGIVNFSTSWVEVGDPTNQQDLQATGLINVGGV